MDMLDSFRDGEQFSTFDSYNFMELYPDDSTSLDNHHNFGQNEIYEWNMDGEREINGDIALIPMTDSRLNESPPNDFQALINDWSTLISSDLVSDEYSMVEPILAPEENEDELMEQRNSPINDLLNISDSFDLTSYIVQDEPPLSYTPISSVKKPKAPVKKIDLKAQRYIVDDDEDEVDVETISETEENSTNHKEEKQEEGNFPVLNEEYPAVLEACDLNSLLEQFEATVPDLPINFIEPIGNPYDLPNVSIKPDQILLQSDFNGNSSFPTLPETPAITKMPDGMINGKEEQINRSIDQKCGIVVKREIDKNDNEMPSLTKPNIESIKKECDLSHTVKVKNEPSIEQKKIKKQLKSSRENTKKAKETVSHQKSCKVKVEPFNPTPETKYKKVEPVKPTRKDNAGTKQNSENTITSVPPSSDDKTKLESVSSTPNETKQLPPLQPCSIHKLVRKNSESTTSPSQTYPTANKQIIDSLPQELIARIKESGKRKTISVIPPMPAKKRGGPRMQETSAQSTQNKENRTCSRMETVQLDHDYCGLASPYPKHPKKDSGFESAEEDDRPVIGKQPTVKNADGKLMVSLLKVNTIHNNQSNQKKKLNLEEYKKRREGSLKTQNNFQIRSPNSDSSNSLSLEDENTRRIRHQQKLMKMAMEVLNTPAKPEKKPELPLIITPPQPIKIPNDMEKKTLVSIGVNTDFNIQHEKLDPLAPVEKLDEIKPLLEKVSDKINCNSLLTSVIENIPKVIDRCDQQNIKADVPVNKIEHGEDKTIVYLPKNRAATQTRTIECQTNKSFIQQLRQLRSRRYRRRISSSSSSSRSSNESQKSPTTSRHSRRRNSDSSRSTSQSSRSSRSSSSSTSHSSSSSCSSRSRSRSRSRSSNRSRSRSPARSRSPSQRHLRKESERLREVEERRVIYVGRITPGTTRDDLRRRFMKFGPITNISLHARDHGYLDNYGFVTFANKLDAYAAIEHGNDDPRQPKYDLSFGGRRIFCQTTYSDLDNMRDESGYYAPRATEDSFDALLRDVQEKLRKRKV